MAHFPVLMKEILKFLPENVDAGSLLDVTFGGGGHFLEILKSKKNWRAWGWDQDPLAKRRFETAQKTMPSREVHFELKNFSVPPSTAQNFNFILADLGVSSFQLDDETRGMGFRSTAALDFRMNPNVGLPFGQWLEGKSVKELEDIFDEWGEEPRAKKLAQAMKTWPPAAFESAQKLADAIQKELAYKTESRTHPATRSFQALRMAVNCEIESLEKFLEWAPQRLVAGGRLAVISFHSIEDRCVKFAFKRSAAAENGFRILTPKPVIPSEEEVKLNPRSRSAKLRVLERSEGV